MTMGDKVSSDWHIGPTDVINDNWLLITENPETGRSVGLCFEEHYRVTCDKNRTTLRYPSNGSYGGPLY